MERAGEDGCRQYLSIRRGIALMGKWHYNQAMIAPSEQPMSHEQTQSPDPIREAVDYGIDLSLLRANVALSPAERLRRHQVALDRMRKLQRAKFL